MIDYVKLKIEGVDVSRLLELEQLEFITPVSQKTGEVLNETIAPYHHCDIAIKTGERGQSVYFSGSIHKMHNYIHGIDAPNKNLTGTYKGFNGNQFGIEQINEVRQHLENLFDCNASQMIFQNIEFGVNTTPIFEPQQFIKGLLFHHGKLFEYRHNQHFAEVSHQRYYLKIYNKSNQYAMSEKTLRVELKIKKSEDLRELQIKSFADITPKSLHRAKEQLIKRFKGVVYYDKTIRKKELTKRQKQNLRNYSNPRYWIGELEEAKRRHRHKENLQKIITHHSENLKVQIIDEINKKCRIINRLSKNPKCRIINSSNIGLIIPHQTSRKCALTGHDISMQKESSKLLSNTGLKKLEEENKNEFERLKKILLTGEENKFEKSLYDRMSKQIRNRYYNNRNKYTTQSLFGEVG